MARNLECKCLCHDDPNTDFLFSCKMCYAANHMASLPRRTPRLNPKPVARKKAPSKVKA